MAKSADAEYEKGMIDLGKEVHPLGGLSDKKSTPVTHYPSLFINDVPELDNLPDGEFYFIAKGQVTRHTEENPVAGADDEAGESEEEEESEDEGEEGNEPAHCSCEITVLSMKPVGAAAEEAANSPEKDAGEKLDDALDSIAKKKADAEEDMADKGADEAEEE